VITLPQPDRPARIYRKKVALPRQAALELNRAIRVLGSQVDSDVITWKITEKFLRTGGTQSRSDLLAMTERIRQLAPEDGVRLKIDFLLALGGKFQWSGWLGGCIATYLDEEYEFKTERAFAAWVTSSLLPKVGH
jgi:hypothetical protein